MLWQDKNMGSECIRGQTSCSLAFLVSALSLFLDSQAALQKQQEVAAAGASLPASSKVNAAVPSDMMSVNGQAKTHTDNSEKELEPEVAEEVLENGPKGTVCRMCSSIQMLQFRLHELQKSRKRLSSFGEQLRICESLNVFSLFYFIIILLFCFHSFFV